MYKLICLEHIVLTIPQLQNKNYINKFAIVTLSRTFIASLLNPFHFSQNGTYKLLQQNHENKATDDKCTKITLITPKSMVTHAS